MARLSDELKRKFAVMAQAALAEAVATCLACGMTQTDIDATVRNAMAGATVRRRHTKKVEATNG